MTSNKQQADEHLRMVEALLFASAQPLSVDEIAERLPAGADVAAHIETIRRFYSGRGIHLVSLAGKWMFRTASDLSFLMRKEVEEQKKLSRAGVETLAIIAYHQPVTRAEIEEIRGVGLSKGTLDVLMEAGWVKPRGRRRTPGRPVTYGTTEEFLVHFGLEAIDDLPGLDELKAAGMLDSVESALSKMELELKRNNEEDERQLDIEDAICGAAEDDIEDEFSDAEALSDDEPDAESPRVEESQSIKKASAYDSGPELALVAAKLEANLAEDSD